MANLPKKGEQVLCVTARNKDAFTMGCAYDVEKVSKAKRIVSVYGDDGNLHAIDYPCDVNLGSFTIND